MLTKWSLENKIKDTREYHFHADYRGLQLPMYAPTSDQGQGTSGILATPLSANPSWNPFNC